mgnify:CR=1 FL=1
MAFAKDQNVSSVRLVHKNQTVGSDGLLNGMAIGGYIIRRVTHRGTDIQAVIRCLAKTTVPGKNPMNKLWIQEEIRVPEVYGLFPDPQKVR